MGQNILVLNYMQIARIYIVNIIITSDELKLDMFENV